MGLDLLTVTSRLCRLAKHALTSVLYIVRPLLTRRQTSAGDILVRVDSVWTARLLILLCLMTCSVVLRTSLRTLRAGACPDWGRDRATLATSGRA